MYRFDRVHMYMHIRTCRPSAGAVDIQISIERSIWCVWIAEALHKYAHQIKHLFLRGQCSLLLGFLELPPVPRLFFFELQAPLLQFHTFPFRLSQHTYGLAKWVLAIATFTVTLAIGLPRGRLGIFADL